MIVGLLAQLVEQLTLNQRVEGSSPPQPIIAVIVANLFAYENSMGRKFRPKLSTIPYVNSATVPFHFLGANPFDCFKLIATFG